MKKFLTVFALLFFYIINAQPKITVVIVIDQFAAHYLPKLDPYLSHGINHLLRNGIVYTNAYLPYAATSTAVGHASIGTGTLPKDHGIIYNKWLGHNNKKVAAEDGNGQNIMVPTLNAPFLDANKNNRAIAFSLKPRATFGMAGKRASAVWFNEVTGQFETNSNSLLLNNILSKWNKRIRQIDLSWHPQYTDARYYQFPHINDYRYASEPPLINTSASSSNAMQFAERFVKLPLANQVLLDMAAKYIKKRYKSKPSGNLLIWISLSSLDKIGHIYGPNSYEVIDMIYQLSYQIEFFMRKINELAPKEILYVLTADHGVMPIPELVENKFPTSQRFYENQIVNMVNSALKNKFGYKNVIEYLKVPHVMCNKKLLKKLSPEKKKELFIAIKKELKKIPAIKAVYLEEELFQMKPQIGSIAWLLKNNVYPGRSGNLLIETAPHALISKYEGGTKHNNPQPYNTHVPLVLYQEGKLEQKVIPQKVWMPQITATLARELEIAKPSSATLAPLPLQ